MKGIIGLDIDGTIAFEDGKIPSETLSFLKEAAAKGWFICFITGRSYMMSASLFKKFDFPHHFAFQNGSLLVEMPSGHLIYDEAMEKEHITALEDAYQGLEGHFLLFAGVEDSYRCYCRPHRFSYLSANCINKLNDDLNCNAVETFPDKKFLSATCIGKKKVLEIVSERLAATNKFELSFVKDKVVGLGKYLIGVTKRGVDKGFTLRRLFDLRRRKGVLIAAGNDNNDLALLRAADIKIAIEGSPKSLLNIADYVVPAPDRLGVVTMLKKILIDF